MSELVRALQKRVGVTADGAYGPATHAAVMAALDRAAAIPAPPQADWRVRMQAKLGVVPDGVIGPSTYAALFRFTGGPGVPAARIAALAAGAAKFLPGYGIDVASARLVEFFGECGHETGGWQWLREIWGPTDAQRRYEGRADLGNTQPGDGQRFLGRGLIQLTGRSNYQRAAEETGLPLIRQPELLEQPENAVLAACLFWKWRGLNNLADTGQSETISRRINGGRTGIEDRNRRKAALRVLVS